MRFAEDGAQTRPIPGRRVTVGEMAAIWQDAQLHHRPSTRRAVSHVVDSLILPTLRDVPLGDLDRESLQGLVTGWVDRGVAPSRIQVGWSHLSGILKLAVADGLIASRPTGVKLPRREDAAVVPLTAEQVAEIADRVPWWWRSLVVLGATTGMRSAEMRGLTWDRVTHNALVVDRQLVGVTRDGEPIFGPPKTPSSRRRIALGPTAHEALEVLRALGREHPAGLVFVTRQGSPLGRSTAGDVWRRATRGMGLRGRSGWHDLRHFHASLLIADGLSPVAVAHRLGHKDATETLRTYAHLWPSDESRAVAAIEGAIRSIL